MDHFRPDDFERKYDHDTNDYEETSFITPGADTARVGEISGTTISCKKNLYSWLSIAINAMTKQEYTPALGRDYSKFEPVGGRLLLKAH